MSKLQRIENLLGGIFMLACAALLALIGTDTIPLTDTSSIDGIEIIAIIIAFSLMLYAVRTIGYYFLMARHMVGGKAIFYRGLVLLDIGLFAASLSAIPRFYILTYLVAINGFAGILTMVRALSTRRAEAQNWRLMFLHGLINLLLAIICIIFAQSELTIIYIYAASLAYSALARIVSAFRRTALVYIQ